MNRARAFHALTAVVALVALVLQLVQVTKGSVVLVDAHPPGLVDRLLRFVAYFTIQSNVLVLVTATQLVQDPARDGRAWRVVRAAAVSGITVTGLVHWFLLRKLLDLHGADYLADRLLHLAVPLLAVAGWLVLGPRPRVDWGVCLRAAVWPVAWLAVILLQAAATGWYPYPFLDHSTHGWGRVVVVCVGILVLFFAVFAVLREYDRRMRPAPASAPTTVVTGS
ncbi:Pr6Pr family membrane protein [Nocardioides cynanchi]|uniref:Pr6Pr family membrane protein n=1 Tax=Nocardioides cynanchi TaxID=2558918 RepID=UPI0012465C23|nr:Pr6Pr family membrane protein [Nocardioides cynanchi]